MSLPKLIITDIDGVWTDGGMYYDESTNEWKKFNTSDSAGVLFCQLLKIPFAIVTGEFTEIVRRRANKLKVEHLFLGAKNKVEIAKDLIQKYNLNWEDVAFIGDDINDVPLLRKVGFSAAPNSAPDYVKSEVSVVLKKNGGEGVFREFVEYILKRENKLEEVLELYYNSIDSNK